MDYAIVVGGRVIDVAVADEPLAANWVPLAPEAGIGDLYDAATGAFTRPVPPRPGIDDLRSAARVRVDAGYTAATDALAAGYPDRERESWPVQISEAQALAADGGADTPWIDAAAAARGVDRIDLAGRIRALDAAYRVAHGTLSGTRQRLHDEIDAVPDDPGAADALASIEWQTP